MPILDQLEDAPNSNSILHKLDDAPAPQQTSQPGLIDNFTNSVKSFIQAYPIIGRAFDITGGTGMTPSGYRLGTGMASSVLPEAGHTADESWPSYIGKGIYNQAIRPLGSPAGFLGAASLKPLSPEDINLAQQAIKPIAHASPTQLPLNPVIPEGGLKTVNQSTQDIIADTVRQSFPPEGTSQKIDQILQENSSPIDKLNAAIKSAKPLQGQQADIYAAERAKRIAAFKAAPRSTQAESNEAMKLLGGEMPKVSMEPLKLEQPDVDSLFAHITNNPNLTSGFEEPQARTALTKLLTGQVPQEGEIHLLGRVFGPDFVENAKNNMSTLNSRKSLISEAVNLPKSLMASTDMSAPLRQGLGLIHRKEYWTSFDDMVKSFGSEDAFKGVQESIRATPTFELKQHSDLAMTDLTSMTNREEQFMSSWAESGIPIGKFARQLKLGETAGKVGDLAQKAYAQTGGRIVRASDRAYVSFLNKLRSDTFDALYNDAKNAGLDPDNNHVLSKEIAGYINTATGRGSLGSMEKHAIGLNNVFFSPRFIASRVQMLNPATYINASPFVRKEYLTSLLSIGGAGSLFVELGRLLGGEVINDATNSDFSKLKIGNTRLDPFGGFQPYITAANRLIGNKTTSSSTGKEQTLGERFGAPTRWNILENFTANKMAPVPKFAYDLLNASKYKPVDMTSTNPLDNRISQMFIPMVIQDVSDIMRDSPNMFSPETLSKSAGGAVASGLGMGVQTYK